MNQDEPYELVLLRKLAREIEAARLDPKLSCDELRWDRLLESDAWAEARRWLESVDSNLAPRRTP